MSFVFFMILTTTQLLARNYYVSPSGNDENPGTLEKPFRTIQKSTDIITAGDVCYIRKGLYRETILHKKTGKVGQPIRYAAYDGEEVIIDGTDIITGNWTVHSGNIYKIKANNSFEQLFTDRKMMIEARWPNIRFEELFDRSKWAAMSDSSGHGKVIDPELAKTGIDWTGALATLNVAHQFWTWSRTVTKHSVGSDMLEYPENLTGLAAWEKREYFGGRYYLSGLLKALDIPGEWYLDTEANTLYLWPLDGNIPSSHEVAVKSRTYGFEARECNYIELKGLKFFGCTLLLQDCEHCVIDNCHLLFPTYSRNLTELAVKREPSPATSITGDYNVVRNCSIAFSSTHGLTVRGSHNLIENNLVHDICWNGSLMYVGIRMTVRSEENGDNTARRNTVYNTGNVCISFGGAPGNIVEYNHVYRGGLVCRDISMIYTQLPMIEESVIRFNWVHNCHAEHIALGIRGDDQTRGLTVHHNVVWDIGWDGILIKGDRNKIYNNTSFDNGRTDILVWATPEPRKPWRKQWPLLEKQNLNTEIINNCAVHMTGDRSGNLPLPGVKSNNYMGTASMLVDSENLDFRPGAGSPLIDAGKHIPGVTDGYKGSAPDIGAYEYGGEQWQPGITWEKNNEEEHYRVIKSIMW